MAFVITIPEGYAFRGATCSAITGDTDYHNSITIPTETSETEYWIYVFVRNKIPVAFAYYQAGVQYGVSEQISMQTLNLALGTNIDFRTASNLSSLGVKIPNGYTFVGAECIAIKGDWNSYNTIKIPNATNEYSYWINVFVNNNATSVIPVTFAYSKDGSNREISKQQLNLPRGATINFKDSRNLSSLGITIPNGYEFKGATCSAITGNQTSQNVITIPNSTNASSYWINVVVNDVTYRSNVTATDRRGNNDSIYEYHIIGSNSGTVWGTGIYTDDSNIAKAAVHAGKVKVGEKAIVRIRILPGQSSYSSTTRNGVTSSSWSRWSGSYQFI